MWPSFLQDPYGMQGGPDAQGSNLGNELTALQYVPHHPFSSFVDAYTSTFIENFGDGQAFFNSPQPSQAVPLQPQSTSTQPQSLPPTHQPLPMTSPHQHSQLTNGTPLHQQQNIDQHHNHNHTSPTSPTNNGTPTQTPLMSHSHSQDQSTPTPTPSQSQSQSQSHMQNSPNGLDMNMGIGLNGMNGLYSPPSNPNTNGTGSSSSQNTPTSATATQSVPPSSSSIPNSNSNQSQNPNAPIVPTSKQEAFLLTAADQASGSRDERLSRVIRSKYGAFHFSMITMKGD